MATTTRRRRSPLLGEEVLALDPWGDYSPVQIIAIYPSGWRVHALEEDRPIFDVPAGGSDRGDRRLFVLAEGLDPVCEGDRDDRLLRRGVRAYVETDLSSAYAVIKSVGRDGFSARRTDEDNEGRREWGETSDTLASFSMSEVDIWLPVESPSPCPPDGEVLVVSTADVHFLGEYVSRNDYGGDGAPPLLFGRHPLLIDHDPDRFRRFSMQADAVRAARSQIAPFVEGGLEALWLERFCKASFKWPWRADLPPDFVELLDLHHNSGLADDAKSHHNEQLIADLRAGRRTLTVPAGGPFACHPFPAGAPVVQAINPEVADSDLNIGGSRC